MNYKLLFFLILNGFYANSQEFSEWRGSGRTGVYSNEKNLLKEWPAEGPKLLWVNESIPKGYASVAIANQMIYTTGTQNSNDVVIAFDMQGMQKWQTAYGRCWDSSYDQSRSTPSVENDRLYVSSGLGDVACLNALSGEIIWQVKANEKFDGTAGRFGISESLLIVGDKVIYTPGGEKTTMVALNKITGKTVWQSESLNDNQSYASPLLIDHNGKKIITQFTENYFFGVDPDTGNILWKFKFGDYKPEKARNNQTNTPLYNKGEIFLTSGYDHQSVMLKLADDGNSVSVKWVDSVLDVHHGGMVLVDGHIYGANWIHNRMGNWACLNWETGKVTFNTEWENKGSIISADGMLYCYEEKHGNIALVSVNPEKFEVISSFKVPYGDGQHWGHLVINNGILYVRHENALMAYDIKKQ
ncbi:MAG: PQQ-binding-like beta-propeller repeat protein [Salinivirgaceae bacterium]|nr:PQQ-binding-like beta-propeller repeat protein [Salinivirgaceae bacterium]